ncbi:HAD family hydrolase [Paracraurococcus lichenis]|uniref:HAD family hydrolase n=1 Tax=Paracraurococcus lichenis TaxID=3064888 RepID=A0ABT9E437_9PROT|nr:hypothetical protein [Paracraurococcus sp. LOR1-02]MDO9710921.1 hypothetical protein [Paracraurococcus sp. LOR1-02]
MFTLFKRGRPVATAPGPGALASRIANFPVVSCDVFDTALVRLLARPEDVHLATGARARARGLTTFAAAAFREYRVEAERSARAEVEAEGRDEVTIAEIYGRFLQWGLVGDRGEAEQLAKIELATEHSVCRAAAALRMAVMGRAAGQKLIFVSDSPLPGAWIEELLRKNGYERDFEVFSSADAGLSKHSGRLFPFVLNRIGCTAREVVHLGDNPIADVARAEAHGITAVHIPQRGRPPEADRLAGASTAVRLLHSHRRSLAVQQSRQDSDGRHAEKGAAPERDAIDIARYGTILLLGYTLFVLSEARKRGIDRVYFVARDGYLPWQIAQRLAPRLLPGARLHYLYASRRAVVLPARMNDLAWVAGEIAGSLSGQTLDTAFDVIGTAREQTAAMLRELGMDPSMRLGQGAGQAEVLRLLEGQRAFFTARMAERRAALLAYLRQSGFLEPGPRIVADIGWRGSIQEALQMSGGLRPDEVFGCYVGLWPNALRERLNPGNAAGYLFAFGHPRSAMDVVADGYAVPELFFSAPHGSTIQYEMAGEIAHPNLAVEQEPGASSRRRAFEVIERECLAEIEMLDTILDGAWEDGVDPCSALVDLEQLLTRPTAEQVKAINRVPFISGINAERITALVNPVPLHEWVLWPQRTLRRIGRSPWRGGTARASLPWPIPSMTYRDLEHRARWLFRRLGRSVG